MDIKPELFINVASRNTTTSSSTNQPIASSHSVSDGNVALTNGSSHSHSGYAKEFNARPPSFQALSNSSAYSSAYLQRQRSKLLSASAASIFERQQKEPKSASYGLKEGILSTNPSPLPSRLSPSSYSSFDRHSAFPSSSSTYTNSSLIDRLSPAPFATRRYSDSKFTRLNADNYTSSTLTSRLSPAPPQNNLSNNETRIIKDPDVRKLITSPERSLFLSKSLKRRLRALNFNTNLTNQTNEVKALEAEDSDQLSEESDEDESSYEDEDFEDEELGCESLSSSDEEPTIDVEFTIKVEKQKLANTKILNIRIYHSKILIYSILERSRQFLT